MKKLKIVLISVVAGGILLVLGSLIALKVFLPKEKIKEYIVSYVQKHFNREVSFDSLSFNIIGINMDNFALSEKSTFKDGTFIKAGNLTVKLELRPLLSKEIKISALGIDGMDITVKKDKNGKFNFDDMIVNRQEDNKPADGKNPDKSKEQVFIIDSCYVKQSNLTFIDETADLKAQINNFNLHFDDFSLTEQFECDISLDAEYKHKKLDIKLPLKSKLKVNLAKFDPDKLAVEIISFETQYNNAQLLLEGKLANVNNPELNLNLTLKNINNKTFESFYKIRQAFNLDSVSLKTALKINLNDKTAAAQTFELVLPQSNMAISGFADWSKKDLIYNLKLDGDILLDTIAPFIGGYKLKGRLKSKAEITDAFFNGSIDLEKVSAAYKTDNDISDLNLKSQIKAVNKAGLLKTDFKNLSFDTLQIKILSCDAKYKDAEISFESVFEKLKEPSLKLSAAVQNLSNNTIKDFYDSKTEFAVSKFILNTNLTFDLQKKNYDIKNLDIKLPESSINMSGKIDWGKKDLIYNISVTADILLDNIVKYIKPYDFKGRVKSQAKISNGNFSGYLNIEKASFIYPDMAEISQLNMKAAAKAKNNITLERLNGVLNGGKFNAAGSYMQNNVNFNFDMDKLTVKQSTVPASGVKKEEKKYENKPYKKQKESFNINLNTNIKIGQINMPHLTSKGAVINTALKSVTNNFDKVSGRADINIAEGRITDTNTLASNKIAKLFLTIFNVLNNNIQKSDRHKETNGIIYNNLLCNLLFANGRMSTEKVIFNMPITQIDTTGYADFNSRLIDMKVNTGLYATMKIHGTIEEPKTSFDVVSTVGEILKSPPKTVEDLGKKLDGALKNLFKK